MTYYNDHTDAEISRREHNHEMGEDSQSDKAWFTFCREVEKLLNVDTLDADYEVDGYCLDEAHGLFLNGTTAKTAAFFFTIRRQMIAKGKTA